MINITFILNAIELNDTETANKVFALRCAVEKVKKNFYMKKLIFGMLLCCAVEASLMAREYYVSPDGSDEYIGSIQKPFATLIRARSASLRGRKGSRRRLALG